MGVSVETFMPIETYQAIENKKFSDTFCRYGIYGNYVAVVTIIEITTINKLVKEKYQTKRTNYQTGLSVQCWMKK